MPVCISDRSAPDLGYDIDILALHDALLECPGETLSNLCFIAIAVCAVDQAVARLQGVIDALCDFSGSGLPRA